MKVIGYIRVSTNKQKLSISNQISEIKKWSKLHSEEIELVEIIQDEGISGDALVRNGFDKMVDMIDSKKIDGVVCLNLSRIGRKASQTLELINKCLDKDVALIDLQDGTDTRTAGGRMAVKMRAVIYEEELLRIRENIRSVIRYKKDNGLKYNGRVVYGMYDKNGILEVDEFEMKIVRNMKNLKSRGHSLYGIAKKLNENKIDTKERGANGWTTQQVKNVLTYHYGKKMLEMSAA